MRLTILMTGLMTGFALLAACSPRQTATEAAPLAPPYNSAMDVKELMTHGMDPAAQAFWKGWGEVYDAKGMHDISAQTPEEWKKVEDGAAMVVLASNTLMLPAFQRKPESEWIKWAKDASDLATQGKEAAEYQDKRAIEDIGGKLYGACEGCHEAFRPVETAAAPAAPASRP